MKILRIAVPTPLRRLFDYLPPTGCHFNDLPIGVRVHVPFGKRTLVGFLMEIVEESNVEPDKLKPVIEIIDTAALIPSDILQLSIWAADYYHHSLGDVFFTALPALLRQGHLAVMQSIKKRKFVEVFSSSQKIILNTAQKKAIEAIQSAENHFKIFLLDGVTGSGKTEVYLQSIETILMQDKQVLVLIPEIGLTPQTIQRFRERFSEKYSNAVVALHSGLSEKERLNAWLMAKSGEAKIVIGTRSAIFSPFSNLGLIIVDEEHDLSFKQQEGFRYHARDLAVMRASFNKIPIVLGSATPALESLRKAKEGHYEHLILEERAGNAALPEMHLLDICKTPLAEGLSTTLLNEIKTHLEKGEQVMLFLNRRGFSPVLLCHSCGWIAKCKRCDTRMTFHQQPKRLHCHHCDSKKFLFTQCEICKGNDLLTIGLGTERLESVLELHFPHFSIARIDRDTTQRKGAIEKLLQSVQSGEHQILIGTQMLAKGHHFPNVTLVAIIDADGGFFSADFRAIERMGQLILQVSGRAGRREKKGKVFIQTHHPTHPLLNQLLQENYRQFAETLLKEREHALLPPFTFFALFRAESSRAESALEFLQAVKEKAMSFASGIHLRGPIPASMPRLKGQHRMQLLVQAKYRPQLKKFLTTLMQEIEKLPAKQRVRWSLDVDPMEMS